MSLLSGLINQTLQKISSITKDAYNNEVKTIVYENIPCRFQMAQSRKQGVVVEAISYTAKVWLYPEYDNIEKDYVVTQDDKDYKILKIEKHYSLGGDLDHISLILE